MRKHLSSNDKVNEIRLLLRNPASKHQRFVLVEGIDDIRLYGDFFCNQDIRVETVSGGVAKLGKAVETLQDTGHVIGIRDADFLHLNNISPDIQTLFVTDFHDAEMLMISSNNVMKKVFQEHLLGKRDYVQVRDLLLKELSFLGGLRWLNDTDGLEWKFKGIKVSTYFKIPSFELDKEKVKDDINQRSPKKIKEVDIKEILELIRDQKDLYNLSNGHDFVNALATYIREHIKECTGNDKKIDSEKVALTLRARYSFSEFKKTKLYSALKRFEEEEGFLLFIENTTH